MTVFGFENVGEVLDICAAVSLSHFFAAARRAAP